MSKTNNIVNWELPYIEKIDCSYTKRSNRIEVHMEYPNSEVVLAYGVCHQLTIDICRVYNKMLSAERRGFPVAEAMHRQHLCEMIDYFDSKWMVWLRTMSGYRYITELKNRGVDVYEFKKY